MAIAHAALEYLVKTTKCKTLFITHYPIVASSLEKKYPSQVQNLHMGYEADTRVDGTRDITFTYRLKTGMASGKCWICFQWSQRQIPFRNRIVWHRVWSSGRLGSFDSLNSDRAFIPDATRSGRTDSEKQVSGTLLLKSSSTTLTDLCMSRTQKSARLISHALTGTSLETVAIMEELGTLSESISSPS